MIKFLYKFFLWLYFKILELKEKIKTLWYRLPLWLRQTIVEALEAAVAVGATYTLSFISGEHSFDVQALTAVMIKAILKSLRANPNIPIKDYVNDQKNG